MATGCVLLVEGTDDEHVVRHLRGHHGLEGAFEIFSCGGIEHLLKSFPIRLKGSGIGSIGVVVDANTDIQARWASLRRHLNHAEFPAVPVAPVRDGFISEPPPDTLLPRVGIWLMPDNSTGGTLENFLRFLVPEPDVLLEHAQQSVNTIPQGRRLFAERDDTKALLHTWLAWQEEPGRPFGTAIKARFLDADVPEAVVFADWLKKLFDC